LGKSKIKVPIENDMAQIKSNILPTVSANKLCVYDHSVKEKNTKE
jgi:hypothetical protein